MCQENKLIVFMDKERNNVKSCPAVGSHVDRGPLRSAGRGGALQNNGITDMFNKPLNYCNDVNYLTLIYTIHVTRNAIY